MKSLVFIIMIVLSTSRAFLFHRPRLQLPMRFPGLQSTKSKSSAPSSRRGEFWEANMDCWRPTINDVERISWGKPATKKGTGSRGIPHRLNEEERLLFDQARRKGFLEINGSGWRKQRRDAPLLNTYRSLCDARGQPSIVLHKGNTGMDELVTDISPLRVVTKFVEIAEACRNKYEGGEIFDQGSVSVETMGEDEQRDIRDEDFEDGGDENRKSFETRPIYQLPSFLITWELSRSEAKTLAKSLAEDFQTKEEGKMSKKPIGVKPGKGRRHGGYGIG